MSDLDQENISRSEKKECKEIIDQLYEKYDSDQYMLSKLQNYICKQLPNILENIKVTRTQNINRIEEIVQEQDSFVTYFLNEFRYFYIPSTEKFFCYEGYYYREISEENVLYHIVNTISREKNPNLMGWKQKTKVHILKRIKETHLTKTIPDSCTIQMVMDALYPSIFSNKNDAKYFITILGDNILRKNTSMIHFISPHTKHFLREINKYSLHWFNMQCIQTFKFKCHEKHYEFDNKDCRLVRIQDTVKQESLWMEILSHISLDILCVACHYSIRYNNSDSFIEVCNDPEISTHVMKMKNTTPELLVDRFIHEYLFVVDVNLEEKQIMITEQMGKYQMSWKNMFYLWKQFLHTHQFPTTAFQSIVKYILTNQRFAHYYNPLGDYFVGIDSSQLPIIQNFLKFWSDTMIIDETETDLEIEEISNLFRVWGESVRVNKWELYRLSDTQVYDAISYFFPDIEIEKNKYINRYRNTLWDKKMDIEVAMDQMKNTYYPPIIDELYRNKSPPMNISIYDAYSFYCRRFYISKSSSPKIHFKPFIVSKSYFEKYILENYVEYLEDSGIILRDWVSNTFHM